MTLASTKLKPLSGPDRRRAARKEVNIPAKIGFRHLPAIKCTVRNVSTMGALLEFEGDTVLPQFFRLVIELPAFWADCEVRHRKGNLAGVMFTSNRDAAKTVFG